MAQRSVGRRLDDVVRLGRCVLIVDEDVDHLFGAVGTRGEVAAAGLRPALRRGAEQCGPVVDFASRAAVLVAQRAQRIPVRNGQQRSSFKGNVERVDASGRPTRRFPGGGLRLR